MAPKSKAAETRKAVLKTPVGSPAPAAVPSTAEKAALPTGTAAEVPVTAGDDYWKAEAEKWRQRWEASANQIMDMESICEKVKSGSGVADPATVIELAKAVDGARIQHDSLKDAAAAMREEITAMFEDACFTVEGAVESATAGSAAPDAEVKEVAKPKKATSPKPKAEKAEKAENAEKAEKKSGLKAPAPADGDGDAKPKRSAKARLTAYFKKVNPDKIASVDKLLKSYKGKEEELFSKLAEKYQQPVE